MNESASPILACRGASCANRLHPVDLALVPGRCTALVGPSGAGKSTLLWLMAGLLAPTTGVVEGVRKGPVGIVFQDLGLWEHLTVQLHLDVVGATPDQRDTMLERTGLSSLRARRPAALSGGERQRLALARALVINPDWLLLDEPMAHLDGAARHSVSHLLRDLLTESRAGVLLATHHAREAMAVADEIAILIDGHLVQTGSPPDVYARPVSLAAARALGPAGLVNGTIVRLEQVRFSANEAGSAIVAQCDFVGAHYVLTVECDGERTPVRSAAPVAIGTRGELSRTS